MYLRACFIFYVALSCSFCFGYDRSSIDDIEKKALEVRLQIESWHIALSLDQERGEPRPRIPSAVETGDPIYKEFWYDGKGRMRNDSTYVKDGYSAQDEGGTFKRMIILGDDYRYSYFAGLDSGVRAFVLSETARNSLRPGELTDIRLIGMVPFAILIGNQKITDIIGNANRTELTMIDDDLDGIATKKISFLDRRSIPVSVWIAPEKGYSIIRIEQNSGERNFHTKMIVRVEKHESSGIWFPVECLCVETDNAGKFRNRLNIKVESASFNVLIPDDIFTPKTMNVPQGTVATRGGQLGVPSGNWIWDGNQIVEAAREQCGPYGCVL